MEQVMIGGSTRDEWQLIPEMIDLMIPGLVLGPEGKLPELNTGDLVAITIKGYP